MGIPIFLFLILGFCIFFHLTTSDVERRDERKVKNFLDEQSKVYIVSRDKLNDIKFIKTDLHKYHLKPRKENSKKAVQDLYNYDNLEIANFGNKSNEELKQEYGSNNFKNILEYQNNYDNLLKDLVSVAELLLQDKDVKGATALLTLSISFGNNMTKNYTLLADIYEQENMRKELFELLDIVKENKNLSQQKIMSYIQKLQKQKGDL